MGLRTNASFAAALAVLLALAVVLPAAALGGSGSRYERRAAEMALPDPVLDPFGDHAPPPMPGLFDERVPDSVDHIQLPEEKMDAAEHEEYERYMIERGLLPDPHDVLRSDRWDGGSASRDGAGVDAFSDPVEW